jgi:hypothetical protein
MGTINVLTLPEYYYLYALFFDYPLNNAFYIDREERERIREMLSTIQRWLNLRQPYEKSLRLRLFTERESLARWSPDLVDEALRQLKLSADRIRGETKRRYPRVHRRLRRESEHRATDLPGLAAVLSLARPFPDRPRTDDPQPPVRYRLTA